MTIRVAYFISHPIQYQAPLLRRISDEAEIELRVIFESDFSSTTYFDKGFGVELAWDVPLRDGYDSCLLDEIDLDEVLRGSDVVWFHGWQSRTFRRILKRARSLERPTLMRGENWSGAMPDGAGARGWLKRLYLKTVFDQCSGFLSVGSANHRYYVDHGITEQMIFPMPYAVDNNYFSERSDAADIQALRLSIGIPEGTGVVLYAGKLTPRKHPELLLEAWGGADWPGARPVLLFAGDGPMRAALESKAPEGVIFSGFCNQSELPGLYALADIFVLPSEREPWGLAINEAMACGTAVVSTSECGASFDLVDEETGEVVPAGDVGALRTALPRVMADAERRGKNAKDRIASWSFEQDVAGLKLALASVH
ncbi:MAG: glycosyltransferase family 4 protein [Proteobacteria bacterium]|nr:glycosyltransferase family 4 protein [Pseudomonadota bacterium]